MRTILLSILAGVLLGAFMQNVLHSRTAFGQSAAAGRYVFVEPGVRMLRAPDGSKQLLGKVIIDLRTGNAWAFPTTVDQPYPVDVMSKKPPTSEPFLLGHFDFAAMDRAVDDGRK
jgi:hypothetical protein